MKNKIYCVHCGKKNEISKNKECMLCKKNLYEKNHELRDYLCSKVKDEISGNIEENILNLITSLIKKYLYGVVVTASVVFAVTSITVNALNNKQNVTYTNEKVQFTEASNEDRILGCFESELEDNYYVFDHNESLKSYQLDHPGVQLKYRFNEEEYYGYESLQAKPLRLVITDVTGEAGSMTPFWWISNDSFMFGDTVYNRVDCNELTID